MPSMDIVSEVDLHEVVNAVDQANREVKNRYDFKGTNAHFTIDENVITSFAPTGTLLSQMLQTLRLKLGKRNVDISSMQVQDSVSAGRDRKQVMEISQGIDKETAKKMIKMVKGTKLKVQASIHDDKVKITGKKRDNLQEIIAFFKSSEVGIPLQYINFRD